MKKNYFALALMMVCLITCSICLSACKQMDRYLSVVPTDQDYKATLSHDLETDSGHFKQDWKVVRKSANICGEDRNIIYVEYTYTNFINDSHNFSKTLMYVSEKVLALEGTSWQNYTGSFGDKWSDIYGSYSNSLSFVYEFTQDINGRDFPKNLRNETEDYLEYDFGRDNEKFRISNNIYHVLLYYNFDYENTHVKKQGTLTLGTPADTIPYLSTITNEMLQD